MNRVKEYFSNAEKRSGFLTVVIMVAVLELIAFSILDVRSSDGDRDRDRYANLILFGAIFGPVLIVIGYFYDIFWGKRE